MKFTVRGSKSKGFTLADGHDNFLGRIAYNNWFSRKALVSFPNNDQYEIVPSGFWQVSFDIVKAEYKTGSITLNWKGNIVITLNGVGYLCKKTGFWGKAFELKKGDEVQATIRQSYEWAKMGYIYDINVTGNDANPDLLLLFLLVAYCTNQQYAGAGAV